MNDWLFPHKSVVNSLFKFWLEDDLPSKLHKNFQGNEIVLQSAQQFRRYVSRMFPVSFSYRSPIILLSFSYHSPIVLLSFSYRSPIILLSFSYRSPIVLLLGNGKQYGNNTETIRKQYGKERRMNEGWTNEDRWNKGGTSYYYLSKFLLQWQESMDFYMP